MSTKRPRRKAAAPPILMSAAGFNVRVRNPEREPLLPCPFDGGKARLDYRLAGPLHHFVQCTRCHASTTYYRIKGIAVAHWNSRRRGGIDMR